MLHKGVALCNTCFFRAYLSARFRWLKSSFPCNGMLCVAVVSATVIDLIISVFKALIRALNIRVVEIGPSQ